ncbi:Fc.00g111520.m01.CDS01 [Cosmosporella sp. VM-42]
MTAATASSSSTSSVTANEADVEAQRPQTKASHFNLVFDQAGLSPAVLDYKYAGAGTHESPYLVEFLPDDPRNPMLFSQTKKWTITILQAIATLAVAFVSTAYSGGLTQVLIDFKVSTEVVILGISLFVLGFAIGPLFWAPLSELYGRQKLFFISYFALTAFNAGAAGAPTMAALIILRFFAGAFGSSPLTNAGGVIADMFNASERGMATAFFAMAPFLGPTIGPIAGGFLGEAEGWRWVEGLMAIFTGVLLIVNTLIIPETYAPVLLRRRAEALSKKTGNYYISKVDVGKPHATVAAQFKVSLMRPWILLFKEPIVLLTSIYMAIIYGTLYMCFAAFPIVFQQGRGWSPGIGGLAFCGIAVGMMMAVLGSLFDNRRYMRAVAAGGGTAPPEARLPPTLVGSILIPAGLFWFAWTNGKDIHWIVPIMGSAVFAAGLVLVFLSLMNYLVDSYVIFAASVLAANSVLRSLFGAAFPLFTTYMYNDLGIHWASSIPAFLALACVPFPFLFYKYGEQIRMKCEFAAEAATVLQRMRTKGEAVTEEEALQEAKVERERRHSNATRTSTRGHDEFVELKELSTLLSRGWRFYGAFGTLCLCTFIIALDSTIICVALPTIAEDLNATAIEAFWCGTSFLLASTVVQPPIASLSHIFGRQPALLSSLTTFAIGNIVAALAKNIGTLLVGRTLQGFGSGGILALTYVITTDLVSLRERGKWFGLISLNWAIGSILGPLLFWINLPFCGLTYIAIPVTLTLKHKEDTVNKKLKEFDWIGTVIFVESLTSFLIPLSWGGIMYDWSSPRTVVPLVIGILGVIAFGFHIMLSSKYSRCDPLIRPSLFTSLTALSAFFATIIHGIIVWCLIYYVPLHHEVRGSSPLASGVALIPFTGTVVPAAVVVGLLIAKRGVYRPFIWVGWVLIPVGMGLMILLERDTETWKWVLIYLTGGLGLGMLYSAQAFAAQASASNADLPFAASMYAFCRSLGQGIGVAVGGVTFQNAFQKQIEKSDQFASKAEEWAKDASALVEMLKKLTPDMQSMKDNIIGGYIKGLHTVWMVLCILACIALAVSVLGVKAKSLDRDLETDQGLIEGGRRQKRESSTPKEDV